MSLLLNATSILINRYDQIGNYNKIISLRQL